MEKNSKLQKFISRSIIVVIVLCFLILILNIFGMISASVYHVSSIIMSILLIISGIVYLSDRAFMRGILIILVGILLMSSHIY